MSPDLTQRAHDAADHGLTRVRGAIDTVSERAERSLADLGEGLDDAVQDAADDLDATPTWAWFAIGIGAMTGAGLAVRAWRRRRDVEAPVRRFETLDEGVSYRSTDDLDRWDMPADELDEVAEHPDGPSV